MAEPIAKIRLPRHHPAVKDMKGGDHVLIKAKCVDDEKSESPMMRDGGDVPSLERAYHVMSIEPMKRKKKAVSAVDYLKEKQDGR